MLHFVTRHERIVGRWRLAREHSFDELWRMESLTAFVNAGRKVCRT
jgi:hypothetical protein